MIGLLQAVMKDRWMNIGFEENQLCPYVEPSPNFHDPVRYELMVNMGFTHAEIENSLTEGNFDNITATYFLLEDKTTNFDTDSQGSNASLRYVYDTCDSVWRDLCVVLSRTQTSTHQRVGIESGPVLGHEQRRQQHHSEQRDVAIVECRQHRLVGEADHAVGERCSTKPRRTAVVGVKGQQRQCGQQLHEARWRYET